MSAHTPGPWQQVFFSDGINICVDRDGMTGETVAQVFPMSSAENGVETDANARLIAAAPEMLEALCETTRLLEWFAGHDARAVEACTAARAALAKAGVQ